MGQVEVIWLPRPFAPPALLRRLLAARALKARAAQLDLGPLASPGGHAFGRTSSGGGSGQGSSLSGGSSADSFSSSGVVPAAADFSVSGLPARVLVVDDNRVNLKVRLGPAPGSCSLARSATPPKAGTGARSAGG